MTDPRMPPGTRRYATPTDDTPLLEGRESLTAGIGNPRACEPLLDVIDEGESLKVIAEVPGVERQDIELDLEHRTLTIRAEKNEEDVEEGDDYAYRERRHRRYVRRIPLPTPIKTDVKKTDYKNGVLEVSLKKDTNETDEQ